MNILIRADSSSTIGTGHIMRQLVLAAQYPLDNIIFAVKNLDGNINYKITNSGYKVEILDGSSIEELDSLIKMLKIDLLIIDHYEINYNFEEELAAKNSRLQIMVLDDTYEKHFCNILLNHNINADPQRYNKLVPEKCELRCGSKYTLLRREFILEKRKAKQRKKLNKTTVFIAMGGADHCNINISILKVLKLFKDINIDIVTTKANRNIKVLKRYCNNKTEISLHINSNNIAKLINRSDFAIVTPSVTVNEVYYMKKPFIAIKTAENQHEIYSYLKQNNYLVMSGFNKYQLKQCVSRTINGLYRR